MNYLFFDIECANCFQGKGKICSFGYCLVDSNFNVIELKDIIINPKSIFSLGPKKGEPSIQLAYKEEEFLKAPDFGYYYSEIKNLLEKKDQIVFGHAVYNDVSFLQSECQRYNKKNIEFRAYDTQILYRLLKGEKECSSLSKLCEKYNIETEHIHESDYDALMTMKLLKAICQEYSLNVFQVLEKCPETYIEIKDGIATKHFNVPVSKRRHVLNYSTKISAIDSKINKRILGKYFFFSKKFIEDNEKLALVYVKEIIQQGGAYSQKLGKVDFYITNDIKNEEEETLEKINKLNKKNKNIKILNLVDLNKLLKIDDEYVNKSSEEIKC